jgi:hypothetical protein
VHNSVARIIPCGTTLDYQQQALAQEQQGHMGPDRGTQEWQQETYSTAVLPASDLVGSGDSSRLWDINRAEHHTLPLCKFVRTLPYICLSSTCAAHAVQAHTTRMQHTRRITTHPRESHTHLKGVTLSTRATYSARW